MFKKILALVLCAALWAGQAALAQEAFAPHLAQVAQEKTGLRLEISGELEEWVPFEPETTAQINALLKHLSLGLDYMEEEGTARHAMRFLVDGEEVAAIAQKTTPDAIELSSDLNDVVYTLNVQSDTQPLALMTLPREEEASVWEEVLLSQISPAPMASYLAETVKTQGTAAKATKSFSKVGRAAKCYKLTADASNTQMCLEEAAQTVNSPALNAFVQQVKVVGTKNTWTVYEDKNETPIAIAFTGQVTHGDSDNRKVTLTWAFKETEGERVDTFALIAPSVKGKNKLSIKATLTQSRADTVNKQTLTASVSATVNKVSTSRSANVKLTNHKALTGHQIEGSISLVDTNAGVKETLNLKPQLLTTWQENGFALSGSVAVEQLEAKRPQLKGAINLRASTLEETDQPLQQLSEVIALEELSPQAIEITDQELTYAFAGRLLKALMALPQQELEILRTGISDENWETILLTVQELAS